MRSGNVRSEVAAVQRLAEWSYVAGERVMASSLVAVPVCDLRECVCYDDGVFSMI